MIARPRKRPRANWHRFEHDATNACWQIDATKWQPRNGDTAWIMDVFGDHFAENAGHAGRARALHTGLEALCEGATEWGPSQVAAAGSPSCKTEGCRKSLM